MENTYVFCTIPGVMVGTLVEEQDDCYIAEDVKMITPDLGDPSGKRIRALPFPPYFGEKQVKIFKHVLVCKPYKASDDLKEKLFETETNVRITKPDTIVHPRTAPT